MKFLSELELGGGSWRLVRRVRRLYECVFSGGMRGARTWHGLPRIFRKNRMSAASMISWSSGWSGGKNCLLTSRVTTAPSCSFSPVPQKPHHAEEAWVRRLMIWARVTSQRAVPAKPWERSVLIAKLSWAHLADRFETCVDRVRVSEMVTPSMLISKTRWIVSTFAMVSWSRGNRGLRKTTWCDLV